MRDEPGIEAFVHREICDPRYSRIRGGYWRTWCTDGGRDLGVRAIRYEELADWPAVTARFGLPVCELPRANQAPNVECPVWTTELSQAIGNACVDGVQRFGWRPPEIDQNRLRTSAAMAGWTESAPQ